MTLTVIDTHASSVVSIYFAYHSSNEENCQTDGTSYTEEYNGLRDITSGYLKLYTYVVFVPQ